MIVLYLGMVAFTQALTVDRRVTNVASSLADLVAQVEEVTVDEVEDIFAAASAILAPYNFTPLENGDHQRGRGCG